MEVDPKPQKGDPLGMHLTWWTVHFIYLMMIGLEFVLRPYLKFAMWNRKRKLANEARS